MGYALPQEQVSSSTAADRSMTVYVCGSLARRVAAQTKNIRACSLGLTCTHRNVAPHTTKALHREDAQGRAGSADSRHHLHAHSVLPYTALDLSRLRIDIPPHTPLSLGLLRLPLSQTLQAWEGLEILCTQLSAVSDVTFTHCATLFQP